MRPDDDYLRELLLKFEANDDWLLMMPGDTLGSSEDEHKERGYVMLLGDLGYATSVGEGTFRLTAQGHDYIAAIRDDGIWKKTKAVVAETGGNATLEIVKAIALGFVKQKLEKHAGIEL